MDSGSIGSVANLLSYFQATGASAPATKASAHGHHFHRGVPQSPQAADDSTATLHYRRTEKTGLSIVTREGDVVSLRIRVRESVDGAASGDDSTQVAQLSVGARSSTKISFHVDGNLNADELAAIQDVVQQVGALADQFFAGDVPAAFAAAQDLNIDSSQLAKVGLRLSMRESVTYSGPALAVPAVATPAPAAPAPVPASTAPDSTPATSSETEDATPVAPEPVAATDAPSTTDESAASGAAPATPSTEPAPQPATPSSVAGNVLATIGDFLHQLLGTLGAQPPSTDGGSQASVSVSLKLRIFAATVAHISATATPVTDESKSNTQPLLGDTLDAVAAAHDPPVSATA